MKKEPVVNKITRLIQTYLLIGFPFVLACMLWQTLSPTIGKSAITGLTYLLWQALGINLMLWFVILALFLVMLIIMPSVRDKTLSRLANLKERDERESYITGKASRTAYVATLSLTIFLLFFSLVSVDIYRVPPEEAVNGKRTFATLSVGFSIQNKAIEEKTESREVLFSSKSFSLSTASILILLLAWQLGVFNVTARKELQE